MATDKDTFDAELDAQGWALIHQFFVMFKIAQLHGANNEAWAPSLQKVREIIDRVEGAQLRLVDNVFYLNEGRVRTDRERYAAQTGLADAFAGHGLGGIDLSDGYDDVRLKELLIDWGQGNPGTPEDGFEALERFGGEDVGIGLTAFVHTHQTVEDEDPREQAKAVYATTLSVVGDVMESVKIKQTLPLKRAKRVMHRLVDQLLTDPVNIMGLTTLRCYDEYTFHHSVNVCVLSLSMGRKMGLPKPVLAQLGMSSLFHDMGKHRIPVDVLNKPGEFSEDEWDLIRRHPVYGVRSLVKMKGADELAARVVTGSFEHHMNYDSSGYPRLRKPRTMSLYGRIISLADCYDAMTAARVYNRTPLTPERALKLMLNKSGKAFDPVLIKVFVNTIGIFPVGTLLLLDSGELAVVVQTHDDPSLGDRPGVRLISDTKGKALDPPFDVGLDEKSPGGTYLRNVAKVVDPLAYGIDVSTYFL
ncbi:MAG: HD-GYP domain-containing protein [Leptospirillia bacterium]